MACRGCSFLIYDLRRRYSLRSKRFPLFDQWNSGEASHRALNREYHTFIADIALQELYIRVDNCRHNYSRNIPKQLNTTTQEAFMVKNHLSKVLFLKYCSSPHRFVIYLCSFSRSITTTLLISKNIHHPATEKIIEQGNSIRFKNSRRMLSSISKQCE